MKSEMESLLKNDTYELVELPKGRKALKNKWVFKLKRDENEQLTKFKARLVVKGFGQKEGIDFDEIFSPVVKMTSIRIILGMAASMDLEVEQLDVKTAFLHGDLEEEIYMEQPEGFEVERKQHMVCKLKKSLYGLKQAPRQWYKKFDSFMVGHGYKRTDADPCVYLQRFTGGNFIILLLYVDDMLIVGKDVSMIRKLKADLSKSFDMKDLGPAKQILGMEITRDRQAKKLWLSQERYVERVLERFNMKEAKSVSSPLGNHFKLSRLSCPTTQVEKDKMAGIPYSSAVGSLMYAMVCTRPDIAHAVGVVSRYLSNPGREHWEAVKWILKYLRGTSKLCLCFGGSEPILEGFTDADLAGDLDNRKSTSAYLFTFSGGAVSWQSKLQKCVALSTTESEYLAANEAGKEMIWLQRFVQELGVKQGNYVVHCDSQSAIHLSKNSMYHPRTKHIDHRYHWIRDAVSKKFFQLRKIHTNKNISDMLTKVVQQQKFEFCRSASGLTHPSI
ncbi:putative RNA-directed DNA polymerase [Rosa chinensis]|uniref:Putative RNA-directed DNA polymerase n=1 Tax=Rosa chinensis TaxID=74649 RepID=A0A2P6Q6P3_ROSCH|nr:putative RNA-directed DNA polymerase [Rosa chinensis]